MADDYTDDDPGISAWRQRLAASQPTVKPWGGPGANNMAGKDKKKPAKKDDKKKSVTTYEQYLAQQHADEVKAKRKSAAKYVHSAQALQGQARALRALLGLSIGRGDRGGGDGGGGGITNTPGGKDIRGNVHWVRGTGWRPDGSGPKRPGPGGGVRTGTDVKPMPGGGLNGPKYGPGGQGGGLPSGGPRRPSPRPYEDPHKWAGWEASGQPTTGPGKGSQSNQGNKKGGKKSGGGGAQPGGWGSDWRDRYPGGGPGGGGGGGGHGGGGDGDVGGRGGRGDRHLRRGGLSDELRQNLKNIELAMREQDVTLMGGYNKTLGSLTNLVGDNEKSADTQGFANISNRGRERMNAISELAMQGGGESDLLRTQGMSLRNWGQNQNEVNRAYHDTLSSTNSTLTDLNKDTKSARISNVLEGQGQKNQLWDDYFDAKSEAWTQLGNTYGQQAQYYGDANEQVAGPRKRRRQRRAQRRSDHAFMMAAKTGSDSHKQQPVDDEVMNWEGAADFKSNLTSNNVNSMGAGPVINRPEGATLRKWNA